MSTMAHPDPHDDDAALSLNTFEAVSNASRLARKWAIVAGGAMALLGLVATFYFSVAAATAAKGTRHSAEDTGLSVALTLFVATVFLVITAGRCAFDLVSASAVPGKRRNLAMQLAGGTLAAAATVAGLTLLTLSIGYGLEASQLPSYYADHARSLGLFECLIATGFASLAAYLMSKAADVASIAQRSALARKRVMAVVGGLAATFIVAIGTVYAAASQEAENMYGLAPLLLGAVPGGIVMALGVPRGAAALALDEQRAEAFKDEMVQDAIAEMKRGTRQRWFARVISFVAGVATSGGGIYLVNTLTADLPWRDQPGLRTFFGLVALGVMVALALHKKLAPVPAAGPYDDMAMPEGGIFDDTLATAASLTVRQNYTLAGILFGDMAGQKFELIDGSGGWCASAQEQSSLLARIFLGGRRPLDIVVDDLGEAALRVTRPTVWLRETATVTSGDRAVGKVARSWSPLRRVYQLSDAEGRDTLTLVSGWIFKSRYRILDKGAQVGELRRLRKPWYLRMFRSSLIPEQDRFGLQLPSSSDLDERRLLVGTLFLVDASS
jgi:hypothetical protein